MHPDLDESAEDCDICDRGGRRSGPKRPSLAAEQRQPARALAKRARKIAQQLRLVRRKIGPDI
jgi:hypothetical protein